MDVLARLGALLDRAEADGLKVISIVAVRRMLAGLEDPATEVHILTMTDGRWLLRHPDDCPDTVPCPVAASAGRTLTGAPYSDGRYVAWVSREGLLCTRLVQP